MSYQRRSSPFTRWSLQRALTFKFQTLLEEASSEELAPFKHEKPPLRSKTGEKPKIALKKSHSSAFFQSLIHLPPVAITLGILSLTFRSVFWEAPGPNTNSALNALQFAAKVHESLIIVSLGAMAIYYIRCGLVGSRGVPTWTCQRRISAQFSRVHV